MEQERKTLSEWLAARFFTENQETFQVFYDRNRVLEGFFQNEKNKHNSYRILFVQSTPSPSEFIGRKEIVADFKEDAGWYDHKWIIYVTGDFCQDIENFESFYYYEKLGKVYRYDTLLDLLLHPQIKLIDIKNQQSMVEKYPVINPLLSECLLELPISCLISGSDSCGERSFNESAAWMAFLAVYTRKSDQQEGRSSLWHSKVVAGKAFDDTDVVLELIRTVDPINLNLLLDPPYSLIKEIFRYLNTTLFSSNKLPENAPDFNDALKKLVEDLSQWGVPFPKKKAAKKTVQKSILESSPAGPSSETRATCAEIMAAWTNSGDTLLQQRYREWMTLFLAEQGKFEFTPEKIEEASEGFAFNAKIDIGLMNFWLDQQKIAPKDKTEWEATIQQLIEKREAIWKRTAPAWWDQYPLFVDTNTLNAHKISLEKIWNVCRIIGTISTFQIADEGTWKDVESLTWEIENIFFALFRERGQISSINLECFAKIQVALDDAFKKYADLNQKLTQKFIDYYLKEFPKEEEKSFQNVSNDLLQAARDHLTDGEAVGFIFCDALRTDLAMEIKNRVEENFRHYKSQIKSYDVKPRPALAYLPSTTIVGWTEILSGTSQLVYVPHFDPGKTQWMDVALNISGEEQNNPSKSQVILRNDEDRNARLKLLLNSSGKEISIWDLGKVTIIEEIGQLKNKKREDYQKKTVPVIWFNKIDDHNKNQAEFFSNIDKLLEELAKIIFQLHRVGIKWVYIFTDHGFIFAQNQKVLDQKELPNVKTGIIDKRFVIVPLQIPEEDHAKYEKWAIFDPQKFNITIKEPAGEKTPKCTVISPRDQGLFKKLEENEMFVHGGLSYQECNVTFLLSMCELLPNVEVAAIDVLGHEAIPDGEGGFTYVPKEMGDMQYLEIEIKGSEVSSGQEPLKQIRIQVLSDDARISTTPKNIFTLQQSDSKTVKLSFKKTDGITTIPLKIVDANNETLAVKTFKIKPPIYDTGL